MRAVRFTTGYVQLVGQEPAPSKCVLLGTSRAVRWVMRDWVLSQEGDRWSVKFDVRDHGCHLDTTFRGWSSTLAARVRLVIARQVVIFALPLDFHGRIRVVRSVYLPAALHGIEASLLASDSQRKLRSSIHRVFGLVVSLWLVLVLSVACWMGPLGVILHFFVVWFRFRLLRRYIALWPSHVGRAYRHWRWLVRRVLGMVLFTFFLRVLLRLGFGGILLGWVGLALGCICLVIWLALFNTSRLLLLMLGGTRLQLIFVVGRGFSRWTFAGCLWFFATSLLYSCPWKGKGFVEKCDGRWCLEWLSAG